MDEDAYPRPGLSYSFRPSLLGAAREFALQQDAMRWQVGRFSGRLPYRAITRIRLSFRPVTMQSHRYIAEIWSHDTPKLILSSTTWKSMIEHGRQDNEFGLFMAELHRRIAAAGGTPLYERGMPAYLYWPGVVVFVLVSLGLVALTIRGIEAGSLAGAGFVGGFFLLFLWQVWPFFRRNKPGRYTADALPADLIPR